MQIHQNNIKTNARKFLILIVLLSATVCAVIFFPSSALPNQKFFIPATSSVNNNNSTTTSPEQQISTTDVVPVPEQTKPLPSTTTITNDDKHDKTTCSYLLSSPCRQKCDSTTVILPEFPCFNGCRCPAPQCMLEESRSSTNKTTTVFPRCVNSPFYRPPSQQDQEKHLKIGKELICRGLEKGDAIPVLPPKEKEVTTMISNNIEEARFQLLRFKRATSWMFSTWFDWGEGVPYGGKNPERIKRRNEIERVAAVDGFKNQNQYIHSGSSSSWSLPKFVRPLNDGVMEGRHIEDDKYFGLYVWTNVCFRSEGKVMGYKPKIKQYKGRSEAESVAMRIVLQHMTVYIASVDRLQQPPALVLDMNVLVIGVDWKADSNHGHVLYRAIAARRIGERLWGKKKKVKHQQQHQKKSGNDENVVDDELKEEEGLLAPAPFHVIYVIVLDNVTKELEGHEYFNQLVGHSWSVVIAKSPISLEMRRALFERRYKNGDVPYSPTEVHEEILRLAKQGTSSSSFSTTAIPFSCFKEVVVYHVCHDKCRYSTRERIGNRFMFPYLGRHFPIHAKIIQRFRKVISNCLSSSENQLMKEHLKTSSSTTTTRITLIARTLGRKDYGLAYAIPQIHQKLVSLFSNDDNNNNKKFSFQVISQHEHTANSFFDILLNTDIVVGSMGASLSFASWMIRKGGVVVEIVGTSACTMNLLGWNQAPKCDFGGAAQSAGNEHLVVNIPRSQSVPPLKKYYPTPGIYVGVDVYQKVFELAVCRKIQLNNKKCKEVQRGDPKKMEWKFSTWREGVDS